MVQPFKKGPDYIDPAWLTKAAGRDCINLDFNTMGRAEIDDAFATHMADADIALIESNKGLFDGLDVAGSDSNAELAKQLRAPVILVLDTTGITRGIAPLINGYVSFDAEVNIVGLILNKVGGPRHEAKLRAAVERYSDLPVLGAIGRDPRYVIVERHLGLTTPGEMSAAGDHIDEIAGRVAASVDIDSLLELANAMPVAARAPAPAASLPPARVRIGYARDAAFGFYYPDDLEAMGAAGAELVAFDTLNDTTLPAVDGLFIGGGFPETQMAALEANQAMRDAIGMAIVNSMPVYAECGGLMYLCRSLSWRGECREMVGVVPGDAVMHDRPQGRGLVRLEATASLPWPGGGGPDGMFPAHEFHYASIDNLPGDSRFAYRVHRGHGIDGRHDGIIIANLLACFSHFRNTAANPWAGRFVAHVAGCKDARP